MGEKNYWGSPNIRDIRSVCTDMSLNVVTQRSRPVDSFYLSLNLVSLTVKPTKSCRLFKPKPYIYYKVIVSINS